MYNFKKSLLSISVLSICLFPSITANADAAYCYINGSNVNVRASKSTSSDIVGKLSNQKVTLVEQSGDWYKVSFNKINGWVKKDFVSLDASPSKTVSSAASSSTVSEGRIKGENVNVRASASTSANIVGNISNKPVKILGTKGEWFKISSDDIEGWVKDDFVIIPKEPSRSSQQVASRGNVTTSSQSVKSGTIKGTNVNLRAEPNKTSRVVAKLSNKKVDIISQSGSWYKVSYNNTTGWVLEDFLSIGTTSTTAKSSSTSSVKTTSVKTTSTTKSAASSKSSRTDNLRQEMVLYSRGFLGVNYRYGGSSPRGFDCSGFTSYIYKKFGIDINRTSNDQAKQGTYVAKSDLQPGDLVFFDTNGGKKKVINHVGMYIGNGKFIHASSSRKDAHVRISSLSESFYAKTYVTARSFVK